MPSLVDTAAAVAVSGVSFFGAGDIHVILLCVGLCCSADCCCVPVLAAVSDVAVDCGVEAANVRVYRRTPVFLLLLADDEYG